MKIFITIETTLAAANTETLVLGAYSTKEGAQMALAKAIRESMEDNPEGVPFQQEMTEKGLLVRSSKGAEVVYNIVDRTLDE